MKLYHRDIYMPLEILMWPKTKYNDLVWSNHALEKLDTLSISKFHSIGFICDEIVEAETHNNIVTKLVIRKSYSDDNDLCIVLRAVLFENRPAVMVITLWFNAIDDNHSTLDDSRYDKE